MAREKAHIVETAASVFRPFDVSFHRHILLKMSIVSRFALNPGKTVNTGYETLL